MTSSSLRGAGTGTHESSRLQVLVPSSRQPNQVAHLVWKQPGQAIEGLRFQIAALQELLAGEDGIWNFWFSQRSKNAEMQNKGCETCLVMQGSL